ncbi:hypothetical protein CcaCcLH18_11428 [Colletotrichum camelliae]|nr:hypothetical protein CcaCcLH18_11428 [Colletotrichum camelliae]
MFTIPSLRYCILLWVLVPVLGWAIECSLRHAFGVEELRHRNSLVVADFIVSWMAAFVVCWLGSIIKNIYLAP